MNEIFYLDKAKQDQSEVDKWHALCEGQSLDHLCREAARVRDSRYGNLVTYSRKVFIPLTRLCRDVCHYCTFATVPRVLEAPFLSPEQVLEIARQGQAAGCKEALFTLGEKPELRYKVAREALAEMGFASTLEYVAHVAKLVLDETGLLPHINAGCMTDDEIAMLKPVSPSMGIMLENVSERLCEKGQAHYGSPDKDPRQRLATLEAAGRANVAMTTGILIGIGETRAERIESLLAIADLHRQYGHIQEVIVQNFVPKADTKMANVREPSFDELLETIALARLILPEDISLQVPPNLNAGKLEPLVDAGINDWGGVSPITPDHVNPESPWPHLDKLAGATAEAGKLLQERLTIYPQYQSSANWLDNYCRPAVRKLADAQGLAREDDWLTGVSEHPPRALAQKLFQSRDASPVIGSILKQVERGVALTEEQIVRLFSARGDDFSAVCQAADRLRKKVVGDKATFVVNRNINYTNICSYHCSFCAFSKGSKHLNGGDAPYLKSLDEIATLASEAKSRGATEVCLQGGIHPKFTGDTYLSICRAIQEAEPDLHIHAFSPLEIWHGTETLGLSLREFLQQLKEAGLKTLPGTAAEILHDEVREIICPDKLNTREWLEVMETAHSVGLKTTATIMFGHVDNYHHWAAHLLHIRNLQEHTGGFTEFVPLPFVAGEAPMYKRGKSRKGPTFRESVLMHAVARLVLHPHIAKIQTSWVKMGLEGAKLCLAAGANDFGGVLMNESITRAAGAKHGQEMDAVKLSEAITGCGRVPQQRTTLYQDVAGPGAVVSAQSANPALQSRNLAVVNLV